MKEQDQIRLYNLIIKKIDSEINSEQEKLLLQMLDSSQEAVELYVDLAITHSSLNNHYPPVLVPESKQDSGADRIDDVLKKLAVDEELTSTIRIERAEVENTSVFTKTRLDSKPSKFTRIYNTVVTIAAIFMILFIVYANVFPAKYSVPVGTVVDQYQVKWNSASETLGNEDRILTNQGPYKIDSGIIKIAYDYGVDLVIEGPAEFTVDKMGIQLEQGRLYAMVSEAGHGFTVDSPGIRFVDVGTEFGIETNMSGLSELHVLSGEVVYFAGQNKESKQQRSVTHGNAIGFDKASGRVQAILCREQEFVRSINSGSEFIWRGENVSLADIVGGGNGFGTGKPDYGIYPDSGKPGRQKLNVGIYGDSVGHKVAKNDFYLTEDNKNIDGVFVPDGEFGAQKINSIGTEYLFPKTNGVYWGLIFNGANHLSNNVPMHQFRLNDITYGTDDNPAICMHSSQAITFDLDAIRVELASLKLTKFTSRFGISESVNDYQQLINDADKASKVDVFVFVDETCKWTKKGIALTSGVIDIEVEIGPEDRFLTLAVTDGGNTEYWDWALFAEPILHIEK